jgi:hypothetical protein
LDGGFDGWLTMVDLVARPGLIGCAEGCRSIFLFRSGCSPLRFRRRARDIYHVVHIC